MIVFFWPYFLNFGEMFFYILSPMWHYNPNVSTAVQQHSAACSIEHTQD